MDLILASTSPYRRALLERLGVPFRCLPPAVDEAAYRRAGRGPRALAELLAVAKANSLRDAWPESTLIGSDQLAAVDGLILGKPGSDAAAAEQLALLAGRSHELIT